MVIQHNLSAANAAASLNLTTKSLQKSTEKLSSGYRINRAADDAAGLSISEKMRSQIRGLNKAVNNCTDGISVIQTAEGALSETHSILQRMNELATQAANDTNTTSDRAAIKDEIDQLALEIDRVASTTQFNTMNLLDGTFRGKNLQVGSLSGQTIELDIPGMDTVGLGLALLFQGASGSDYTARIDTILEDKPDIKYIGNASNGMVDPALTAYDGTAIYDAGGTATKGYYKPKQALFVNTNANASRTMKIVQNAVDLVSQMRSKLGAVQNRLEHTVNNLQTTSENTSAAESRLRDTDMADEMVAYSKNSILSQAGQSVLAQANQAMQGILSLLG